MPRKKIYRTREQQRLANNAKAKRWRDKNSDFLKRQREEVKQAEERARVKELRIKQAKHKGKHVHLTKDSDEAKQLEIDGELIRPLLAEAKTLYGSFQKRIPNRIDFLEDLYQQYMNPTRDRGYHHHSFFEESSKPLQDLDKSLPELSHSILNVAGPWEEWREVEQMRIEIRELVAMIEEMQCCAIVSALELREAYDTRALQYRQVRYVN
ncbi:hypothetical protein V5O48_015402 [Marasmius crinis-equi]|uniref:Uncharacterized protein n=1 Tax=Marasmius crinis-equi TaxID=585013 RepID=A0ABR3EUM8_9AGAR